MSTTPPDDRDSGRDEGTLPPIPSPAGGGDRRPDGRSRRHRRRGRGRGGSERRPDDRRRDDRSDRRDDRDSRGSGDRRSEERRPEERPVERPVEPPHPVPGTADRFFATLGRAWSRFTHFLHGCLIVVLVGGVAILLVIVGSLLSPQIQRATNPQQEAPRITVLPTLGPAAEIPAVEPTDEPTPVTLPTTAPTATPLQVVSPSATVVSSKTVTATAEIIPTSTPTTSQWLNQWIWIDEALVSRYIDENNQEQTESLISSVKVENISVKVKGQKCGEFGLRKGQTDFATTNMGREKKNDCIAQYMITSLPPTGTKGIIEFTNGASWLHQSPTVRCEWDGGQMPPQCVVTER